MNSDNFQYSRAFTSSLTDTYKTAPKRLSLPPYAQTQAGAKEVYSCEYVKQFILVLLFINYCISFHVNNCKPTLILSYICTYTHIHMCVYIIHIYTHTHMHAFGQSSLHSSITIVVGRGMRRMSVLTPNSKSNCRLYKTPGTREVKVRSTGGKKENIC